MKYYSEKLKKLFDTEKELGSSEKEFELVEAEKQKTLELKKARAKEVEDAYKAYATKYAEYLNLRNEFVSDYGSYHTSYTESGTTETTFADLLNEIFGPGTFK